MGVEDEVVEDEVMDLEDIRKLIALMNENGLAEIEYADSATGKTIRLRKAEAPSPAGLRGEVPAADATAAASVRPSVSSEISSQASNGVLFDLKSPLVGTFYRAPSPGADSFVEVGDRVGPDKVVCIVEAMKVMNEIKAEVEGEVREILVRSGDPVEFGQVLFRIKQSES